MNADQNESKKYFKAFLIGLFLFELGSLIYLFALSMPFANNHDNVSTSNPYFISIIQYVSYVPILVFFVYYFKDDLINDFKLLKNNFRNIMGTVLTSFIMMYVLSYVVNIIYMNFGNTGESKNEQLIDSILLSNAALPMIISVCLLAPISEELLFRKSLFGLCQKTLNLKPIVSIVISTLIFSGIHVLDSESLIYIFQYIPMAAVMCYCYYKTDNIYASILLHMANNILAVIFTYLPV